MPCGGEPTHTSTSGSDVEMACQFDKHSGGTKEYRIIGRGHKLAYGRGKLKR
jgi:hypothetical protein